MAGAVRRGFDEEERHRDKFLLLRRRLARLDEEDALAANEKGLCCRGLAKTGVLVAASGADMLSKKKKGTRKVSVDNE